MLANRRRHALMGQIVTPQRRLGDLDGDLEVARPGQLYLCDKLALQQAFTCLFRQLP